jgi:hypothetical protein
MGRRGFWVVTAMLLLAVLSNSSSDEEFQVRSRSDNPSKADLSRRGQYSNNKEIIFGRFSVTSTAII